ncbi:cytochrome c peroxidase [Bradyrhizobium sp. Arg237L]|uniref:cytochrome-c peroxidase n=1 Tax=Bradyrhizobium sp. Arg237L TaxID=3003352 RepID=UPI00249DD351|nr:cytochrome c peroxidase [Bradyrhizobium sp. Arg237L]MDI4234064.1 cytochrome c peroxidase [Bradyrhizobium sp. Arg237L]
MSRLADSSKAASLCCVVSLTVLTMLGMIFAHATSVTPRDEHLATLRQAYARPATEWPAPWLDADVAFVELGKLNLPSSPSSHEQRRVALGARLFHDTLLSAGNDLACSTCHDERHGWSSGMPTAPGHALARGRRNPPSLHNVALRPYLAWDGRGSSLAAQSLAPLTISEEMANKDLDSVLARLHADTDYAARFAEVYGAGSISADKLADALVAFQTRLETETRFERFAAGDPNALTDQELWGLHLFRTKARCINCHFGPLLTDDRFHNLKISFFGEKAQDLGRYQVTHLADDVGRFRTPSLRHVGQTAPYMHNGLFPTLEGVINLYDRGGGEVWARNKSEAANPLYPFATHLSSHIRPLGLSDQEKAALASFLRTL